MVEQNKDQLNKLLNNFV